MRQTIIVVILVVGCLLAAYSIAAQSPVVCDRNCIGNTRTILKDAAVSMGQPNSWIEMANLRLGDKVAVALREIYRKKDIFKASNVRTYLPVIRRAFSIPSMISEPNARYPESTLRLLSEVELNIEDPILLKEVKKTREYVQRQGSENPAKSAVGRINAHPCRDHGEENAARERGPVESLAQFWRSARDGDETDFNRLTTEVPSDFFDRSNKCALIAYRQRLAADKSLDPTEGFLLPAVGESLRGIERYGIRAVTAHIRSEEYPTFRVDSNQIIGQDAIVSVSYGAVQPLRYRNLFLFREIDGEWKLYMITTQKELESTNKNFSRESCDGSDFATK